MLNQNHAPARIERWNLRLQSYDFTVVHTKGSQNPSDFLSRHPDLNDQRKQEVMAEEYINFLSIHAVPKAMTLSELQEATKGDQTLQKLAEKIQTGNWNVNEQNCSNEVDQAQIKLFGQIKDELTVNSESNIILRGNCIVIPTSLQDRAISLAHECHQDQKNCYVRKYGSQASSQK